VTDRTTYPARKLRDPLLTGYFMVMLAGAGYFWGWLATTLLR